jgi:hemoglobin
MQTIYDKYGGHAFFKDCIYSLYLDMFDHPEISYHFVGVDIEILAKHQTEFLIRAIGGPDIYQGRPIKDVHRHLDITAFQFNEIAKAFRQVFLDKGIAPHDVNYIMNFIAGHESDIVTEKTSFIDRIMRPIYRFFKKLKRALKGP